MLTKVAAWARERSQLIAWALILIAITTLAGPFGTYEALSLAPRLLYWSIVVIFSFAVSLWISRQGRNFRGAGWARRGAITASIAVFVFIVESFAFDEPHRALDLAILFGVIGLSVLLVEQVIILLERQAAPNETKSAPDAQAPPQDLLMRALPLDKRGRLIRVEAQDHYVKVVTDRGECLISMRMRDVEAKLDAADGFKVHRSHWVARDAIERHIRRRGRDFLKMSDGFEAPVSRRYQPVLVAAGLVATAR